MSPIIMCPSKIIQEYILNIWSAPIGNDSAWLLFSKLIYVPVTVYLVYLIIIYLYSFKTCWLFCTPIWVSGVRLDDEMLRINKSTHPPPLPGYQVSWLGWGFQGMTEDPGNILEE